MNFSIPEYKDFAHRIGPALNRTVGHLAGSIQELSLLYVNWLLAIERALFTVGVELIVSAVDLHRKTHRFVSGRQLCPVEQFIVSFWHDNIGSIAVYSIVYGFVNAHS